MTSRNQFDEDLTTSEGSMIQNLRRLKSYLYGLSNQPDKKYMMPEDSDDSEYI
jgi:hypothetical protein